MQVYLERAGALMHFVGVFQVILVAEAQWLSASNIFRQLC